jgi:hypothetical protein
MPDNKKFHEFALQSILFKGRPDWYFCYLKTERIAHVLVVLAQGHGSSSEELTDLARRSAGISGEIAHLAAGEVDAPVVLADLFALLGAVRMLAVRGILSSETAAILSREMEAVAERLVRGSHPSPFVSTEDFSVSTLPDSSTLISRGPVGLPLSPIKDNSSKRQDKGQSERMSLILELVREKKSLSIKEIAAVVKDCSEKTIQRELNALIDLGLIRREGERRWSVYLPA